MGVNSGTISGCYATGSVTAFSDTAGGLVGDNRGTVSECYATGSVFGGSQIGGLVGDNAQAVSNCYATGNVTGVSIRIGGLVGRNKSDGGVSNCYAVGLVNEGIERSSVGGLVGCGPSLAVSSYWATDSSGQSQSAGGSVGKLLDELKQANTFVSCINGAVTVSRLAEQQCTA